MQGSTLWEGSLFLLFWDPQLYAYQMNPGTLKETCGLFQLPGSLVNYLHHGLSVPRFQVLFEPLRIIEQLTGFLIAQELQGIFHLSQEFFNLAV